jgi:hypothetical protein
MITHEELIIVEQVFEETRRKFIWTRHGPKKKHYEFHEFATPLPDRDGILREDCDGFVFEIIRRSRVCGRSIYPAIVQTEYYFGSEDGYDHMVGVVECGYGLSGTPYYYIIDNRSTVIRMMDTLRYKKWRRQVECDTPVANWESFDYKAAMLSL